MKASSEMFVDNSFNSIPHSTWIIPNLISVQSIPNHMKWVDWCYCLVGLYRSWPWLVTIGYPPTSCSLLELEDIVIIDETGTRLTVASDVIGPVGAPNTALGRLDASPGRAVDNAGMLDSTPVGSAQPPTGPTAAGRLLAADCTDWSTLLVRTLLGITLLASCCCTLFEITAPAVDMTAAPAWPEMAEQALAACCATWACTCCFERRSSAFCWSKNSFVDIKSFNCFCISSNRSRNIWFSRSRFPIEAMRGSSSNEGRGPCEDLLRLATCEWVGATRESLVVKGDHLSLSTPAVPLRRRRGFVAPPPPPYSPSNWNNLYKKWF